MIKKLQRLSIYIFAFSLNFETVNLFNLDIDYLASKITIVFLFAVTLLNFPAIKSTKKYFVYLRPLFIFFIYLTYISYLYRFGSSVSFFYFPLFLDLIILFLLVSAVKQSPNVLFNSMIAFSLGTIILSILFHLNIGVEVTQDGRMSIFEINQNMLGLYACFAIFTFVHLLFGKINISFIGKFILLGIIFLLFLMLIKTGSRGAFLSFVVGIFFYLFSNKRISRKTKVLITGAFVITTTLLWVFFMKNSVLFERLDTSVNDGDLSNRDLIWLNLFDIIVNNYTFGVGVTGYDKLIGEQSPHNVLIEVLCYSGIIGLSIFIFFLYKIGQSSYRILKSESNILPLVFFVNSLGLVLTGQIFAQKIIWLIFAYQIASVSSKAV
jgi:O-antigen ligase